MANSKYNLILAEYAVEYVQTIMSKGLGPDNRMESVVHKLTVPVPPVEEGPSPQRGWGLEQVFGTEWEKRRDAQVAARNDWPRHLAEKKSEIVAAVARQRSDFAPLGKELFTGKTDGLWRENAAVQLGAIVEKSGLGNCGEQSCVAFKYLITRGAPGLAIVNWEGGNHTFVVIGMDPNVPKVSTGTLTIAPVWGPDAVVCDPWYHEWFAVESIADWQSKMKRIFADANARPLALTEGKAAAAAGTKQEYAKGLIKRWKFDRLAYLRHGDTALTQLACGLEPMRASAKRNLRPA
jgi:hypothetical protein